MPGPWVCGRVISAAVGGLKEPCPKPVTRLAQAMTFGAATVAAGVGGLDLVATPIALGDMAPSMLLVSPDGPGWCKGQRYTPGRRVRPRGRDDGNRHATPGMDRADDSLLPQTGGREARSHRHRHSTRIEAALRAFFSRKLAAIKAAMPEATQWLDETAVTNHRGNHGLRAGAVFL